MKKWVVRISLGVVALLVLIVVIVQIILWTSLPKSIVVAQIEQQLGLRISTKSLSTGSTGWLGHTTLSDVSLDLPLSQRSFLDVKALKVKHTSLLGMILGKGIEISSIEIDQPVIYVQQDAAGKWNLLEVASCWRKPAGKIQRRIRSRQGIPKLPKFS